MKKYLSQNYLINKNIIFILSKIFKKIYENIIIEVGIGNGNLSSLIIKEYKKYMPIFFVEIDKILKFKNIDNNNNIYFLYKNILKLNLYNITINFFKLSVISNLPYKITKKILYFFLKSINIVYNQFFMIQEEYYKKLKFLKKYNKCFVLFNSFYKIKLILNVNKTYFFPIPSINSCFVNFKPLFLPIIDYKNLKIYIKFLNLLKKNNKFLKKIINKKFLYKNNVLLIDKLKNFFYFIIKNKFKI